MKRDSLKMTNEELEESRVRGVELFKRLEENYNQPRIIGLFGEDGRISFTDDCYHGTMRESKRGAKSEEKIKAKIYVPKAVIKNMYSVEMCTAADTLEDRIKHFLEHVPGCGCACGSHELFIYESFVACRVCCEYFAGQRMTDRNGDGHYFINGRKVPTDNGNLEGWSSWSGREW